MLEPITATETYWRYSAPPDTNAKVLLLTKGRIATLGKWGDGMSVIAWCPLPKRDKEVEARQNL